MSTAVPPFEYDADRDPDPRAWLAASFAARIAGVRRYHDAHVPEAELPARVRELHASVHVTVEGQVALGRPEATGATLRRLRAEGLSRHEALHSIGAVVGASFLGLLERGRLFDEGSLSSSLEKLKAAKATGAP